MEAFLEKFQHDLKVFSFEEIKSITRDFDKDNLIGQGGFGQVYRGVVHSDSKGQITAAFKRLDSSGGQGIPEFLKEIMMLSHYRHENIVNLLGFCNGIREKILVYEHAAHGSLDVHLSSTTLTWTQRLNICLGAARGLCYLHDPKETHERVIHRDIKSANILLDENWNAKIADMGLSKRGPANQGQSFVATNVAGTLFYADPEYMETSILTKESDVYSFGVVLLEVLCGTLCFEMKNGIPRRLVQRWVQRYEKKKLEEIIFYPLRQGMDRKSSDTFSEIAYECLVKPRAQRPSMSHVVEKIEIALHFQEEFSKMELEKMLRSERYFNKEIFEKAEFQEMVEAVVSKEELQALLSKRFINKEEQELFLSKGFLVNGGNTWFSFDKNGEHCEMISGDCCEFTSTFDYCHRDGLRHVNMDKSRFKVRKQDILYTGFKAHARAQFLSPGITYTVNLVFKLEDVRRYKYLRYTLAGESRFSTSFILHEREDGWIMTAPLCHFICNKETVDLDITFHCRYPVLVEGIEIQSVDKVQHEQVLEEFEEVDTHPDSYWKQKLPSDWRDILSSSKDIGKRRTMKEVYSIFRKGFLINNGEEWFSLANDGKNCHMLSTRKAARDLKCDWKSLPDSRFGETACEPYGKFYIDFDSLILSPQTTYATYLVYKVQENHSRFESPVEVYFNQFREDSIGCYIYLLSHQPPVIRGNLYQKKRFSQQRKDGWMEVPIWEFQTNTNTNTIGGFIKVNFEFKASDNMSLEGLIVEGIEFRPM